ncbi:conserved exported hypothetical protein [Capnocytophaga canis]|uniref:hypothetical protein n=1 Tax=Capnocytophaga canis TaxID=1848903 RepID=UPI0005899735|nr:hypothetical protein [Capnocytophaga canis]CEN45884.1 conserved exported hypothetical protein [Capnocytophaga canis]
MKQKKITSKTLFLAIIATGLTVVGCNKEGSSTPEVDPNAGVIFHLGYGSGYKGTASANVAPITNLKTGSITFEGEGKIGKAFESARTHRFYASADGKFLYDLEYGNGKIVKYSVSGNDQLYSKVKDLSVKEIMGTSNPRWKMIDDKTALLFNITPKYRVDGNTGAVTAKEKSKLRILSVNLTDFTLGKPVDIEIPDAKSSDVLPNAHIWRVDNAIVHNGKAYIGTAVQGFNETTQKIVATRQYGSGNSLIAHDATTLVLDYPSFQNPKLTYSTQGYGETYGYRAPSYLIDGNDVYNISMEQTHIFKINSVTGEYDNSYDFDLKEKLGLSHDVAGTGFFYAGNGIAYVPFAEASKLEATDATWGLARVDLRAKTAKKMNMPSKLWMRYYQAAKLGKDGKLYMAICPTSGLGNIYIFDPTKDDPNGFEKGATLQVSGEGFYMGVY